MSEDVNNNNKVPPVGGGGGAGEKSPSVQWYPKDYLSSLRVTALSLAEEGAYFRALNYCWLHKTLPADARAISRIIGKGCTIKVATVVMGMFVKCEGGLRHQRLDEEREKQRANREAKQKGALITNAKRYGSDKKRVAETSLSEQVATVERVAESRLSSSSSFSSSIAISNTHTHTGQEVVLDYSLKYFENMGYRSTWNIVEPLRTPLDKYLIYLVGKGKPITDAGTVELILQRLDTIAIGNTHLEREECKAAILDYTRERNSIGVIYELPKERRKVERKEGEKITNEKTETGVWIPK